MLRTFLIVPPKYGTDYPLLGTPSLLGYLKSHSVEARQTDWNGRYHHYLGSMKARDAVKINPYAHLLPNKPASELPYGDNTYSSFFFTERILSSPLLLPFINDEKENPFHRFIIECRLMDEIKDWDAELLGLSIISPSQVMFSFTLGSLLKKSGLALPIVIGGQWVSLYRDEIARRDDFSKFFDYGIFFEGETALLKLILSLSGKSDLADVPNLIYKRQSHFVFSKQLSVEMLDELPEPDFAGLPLSTYAVSSAEKVSLTFETSRECYWNKCVYCVDIPHPKQGYRKKNPSLVARDIKVLLKRYPINDLMLSDPAMSPQQMSGISEKIITEKIKVSWWCFARADNGFTREIFQTAKEAGCHSVSFGLETANQRLLDFIRKGINLKTAKMVLKDCYESGLNVQLQMMLGLPTETVEEALETINFLVENRDIIQQVTFNVYYLTPGCLIAQDLKRYGIVLQENPLPFQFFREFSYADKGLSKQESLSLIRLYNILMANYDKN